MAKKVTDLREAVSFEGLVALGVDTLKNESVQVPLGFVKQGAGAAIAAAQSATTAAEAAVTATETIDTKIAAKLTAPTVTAPSVSAISSLVGLNASGVSVNASPDQIREMVGIDHSLLTEQIVPGEYFPYKDGTKRQVYSRTFVGTTPEQENIYGVILRTGIEHIPIYASGIISGEVIGTSLFFPSEMNQSASSMSVSRTQNYDTGEIMILGTGRGGRALAQGLPYTITIKYIKA